ncbi:MAG TPA: hypothetical protein VHF22_13650, partial [Planctomycetota bacterium]|nr:hypothetical protein [Planctomycetota bacterium]
MRVREAIESRAPAGPVGPRSRASGRILALSLLALSLGACRSAPPVVKPPLAAPTVEASVRHFRGTPLGGPIAGVEAALPEDALQATVSFVALEKLPPDLLEPTGTQARLVVATSGERPIRAAPLLLAGTRAGAVDAAKLLDELDKGAWG